VTVVAYDTYPTILAIKPPVNAASTKDDRDGHTAFISHT
jgi:hypothetical protein